MYVRYNDRRYTIDDFCPSLPGCQGIGRLAEQLAITNMGQCAKGRWKSEQKVTLPVQQGRFHSATVAQKENPVPG